MVIIWLWFPPAECGKSGLIEYWFRNESIVRPYYTFFVDIYAIAALRDFVFLLSKVILEGLRPRVKEPVLFCGQSAACHGKYVPECLPSFLSACFDDVSGKHCFVWIHGFCHPAFRTGRKNDCTGSGGSDLSAIWRNHLVSVKDAECFVQFNSSGRELYAGYDFSGPRQCNGFF